ncbi:B-cell receptor-associated protein 29-like isoform 2-T2 [Synchiropus picturatus]
MTLQWTAVALFLYVEIAANLILCLPFISARRWRLVFSWRIWDWLSPYWNKCFFTMIMSHDGSSADALREVNKYSGPESMQEAKVNTNLFDHLHMKLFRAQRNLYISGFSLFLWLIMRRVITLLNQVAVTLEDSAELQAQLDGAVKTAKKHQEDNATLKRVLLEGEKSMSENKHQLKVEVESLTAKLKEAEAAARKSEAEVEAMTRQAKGLAKEYDRLLNEHHRLQNVQSAADKKGQ